MKEETGSRLTSEFYLVQQDLWFTEIKNIRERRFWEEDEISSGYVKFVMPEGYLGTSCCIDVFGAQTSELG